MHGQQNIKKKGGEENCHIQFKPVRKNMFPNKFIKLNPMHKTKYKL